MLADFLPPSSWERRGEDKDQERKCITGSRPQNNRRETNQKMANLSRGCEDRGRCTIRNLLITLRAGCLPGIDKNRIL